MKLKFTIGRRIGLGFAVFILLTCVSFVFTIITLNDSKSKTVIMVDEVSPSVAELKELNLMLQRSHTDISKWFYNPSFNDIDFRNELKDILNKEYPKRKQILNNYAEHWTAEEKDQLHRLIFEKIEALFQLYQTEIIDQLHNAEAYEDANITMLARIPYEDSESNIKVIYRNLNSLIDSKQKFAEEQKDAMFSSINLLTNIVLYLGIALVIGGILIAFFTTRSITVPIHALKKMLLSMGLGILPKERVSASRDEIGEMGNALNDLIHSMEQTTEFAKETGAGNFEATYTPLSKDDNLGHALLKMRIDLAENERSLEQKIIERTAEVVEQKNEAEKQRLFADEQKHLAQEKHKEITDSINYAERIQKSFLASKEILQENLFEHFVFFQPKDVVSGDFYWASKLSNGNFGLATADSTGHGVPGAIMSLLNITSLETAIKHHHEPNEILNHARKTIINRLKNDGSEKGGKDGMDCTFISFDFANMQMTYAAANNPIWIVREGVLIESGLDKMPVGKHDFDQNPFTAHSFELKKGDIIYTLTDGLPDQFGGPKGKKFMYKKLKELLVSISQKPMEEQRDILALTTKEWKGNLEQVDDILLIGTRV